MPHLGVQWVTGPKSAKTARPGTRMLSDGVWTSITEMVKEMTSLP